MDHPVPFFSLQSIHRQVQEDIYGVFREVYDKGQFILGSRLQLFEQAYAAYCGAPYCVGVANGLDALYISLKMLGVNAAHEVIVPAHTYIATWLAVSRTQALIVPADVDEQTMLMDAKKLTPLLSKRTKVIMPVHLYGQACDMASLTSLAQEHQISIVEDNAQAHGATYRNRKTGSFGQCSATSFYPTKNLGALGDGGAITTPSKAIYEQALAFRNYGSASRFVNTQTGINSRLDELQAAVLLIKLQHLDAWNADRKSIAAHYHSSLTGVGDLLLPQPPAQQEHVFHLYVVRTSHRDNLQQFLKARGIETSIHYPTPPHLQKAYHHLGYQPGDFPVSEGIAATALSLPLWPGLAEQQVAHVCRAIRRFYENIPSAHAPR